MLTSDNELDVWCTAFGFVGVRNWSGTYVLMLLVQLSSAQLRLVQDLPAPELPGVTDDMGSL